LVVLHDIDRLGVKLMTIPGSLIKGGISLGQTSLQATNGLGLRPETTVDSGKRSWPSGVYRSVWSLAPAALTNVNSIVSEGAEAVLAASKMTNDQTKNDNE